MLNILKEQIKDNHILILGYGREGHSTLHRILEVGGFASVTVADKNQVQLPDSVKALCGEHYMDTLDDYDLIFNSYRGVLSLLQYLNDTLALCKTFLCILIKIRAELREALQLSELRIFELQST